jgi:hypothetical protein
MSESIDWTQPAEAILDQLLETVERRIPADKSRDDTAWVQLNRIAHVFDSSTLKEMKQSLVRNGYEDFYQILIGGDDFGKPKRINRASEARRKAIDNAESTGDEITTATEEAFG